MIADVIIEELQRHCDSRGWLAEMFRNDENPPSLAPQMGYLSVTLPNISRGPHEHLRQTDYFCFPGTSRFRVYLWDNRDESPTFGSHEVFEAQEDKPLLVIVPPRIVHAYKNIGTVPGIVLNFPNQLYRGFHKSEEVDEIRHENQANSRYQLD